MDSRRPDRFGPPAAAVVLLAAAAAAAVYASPQVRFAPGGAGADDPVEPTAPPAAAPSPTEPAQPVEGATLPDWAVTALAALGGLIAVVLVAFLIWCAFTVTIRSVAARRRSEPPPPEEKEPRNVSRAQEIAAVVDAGLADLADLDGDARATVIACWVRLEAAATAAGTVRRPGDTPTDLVGRLLDAHRISRPVLDGFATVYREARYATHVIDDRMRETAVQALRRLRAELLAGAAAP